jgi:hypothetical protein
MFIWSTFIEMWSICIFKGLLIEIILFSESVVSKLPYWLIIDLKPGLKIKMVTFPYTYIVHTSYIHAYMLHTILIRSTIILDSHNLCIHAWIYLKISSLLGSHFFHHVSPEINWSHFKIRPSYSNLDPFLRADMTKEETSN